MLVQSLFPRELFSMLDRLQREMQQSADVYPSIRGLAPGTFPALNVGGTPHSVEIFAFTPGLEPSAFDVRIEKGVLTIAGERIRQSAPDSATVHIDERYAGRFRRVVSLPEDIDPDAVQARYRDGVLHISIKRRAANQPRRIDVT